MIPNQPNIRIIIATVWEYEDPSLSNLVGPQKDAERIQNLLSCDSDVGVFSEDQIDIIENPTVERLRRAFVDYAYGRSAKGDILIFYFSGHGALVGNNFGFCLADTKFRPDDEGLLPLSVLSFTEILTTLQVADVHPVFIIDACFSGKAATYDQTVAINTMRDNVRHFSPSSHALFCACYQDGFAVDTSNGGAFTEALHETALIGMDDSEYRQLAFLAIDDLFVPVRDNLMMTGSPSPMLYSTPGFPSFEFVRNAAHKPRIEKLAAHHQAILELMWNNGSQRVVSITNIREECGPSAYGNHNKLTWEPWKLVEHVGNSRNRRLTERGVDFVQGNLSLPLEILRDPVTLEWDALPSTQWILYSDLPKPSTQ